MRAQRNDAGPSLPEVTSLGAIGGRVFTDRRHYQKIDWELEGISRTLEREKNRAEVIGEIAKIRLAVPDEYRVAGGLAEFWAVL